MATAALNTAAHSIPPYSIPLGPRIRPPRLLPGTKAENTNPQPEGPAPDDQVWVQGKWRSPASNAAKDRRLLQSKQIEKALRHHTHGSNIYAYRQIRTNQVVYSLTRVMQNNKILDQLVFHKKQTVPASLRRDVWRPYFSIHFPQTPAGVEQGLQAFKYLRDLSLKRQLSPPKELLIATKEDVIKARNRFDPGNLRDRLLSHNTQTNRLPRLNQKLPIKYRARKLMDQLASSVADAAQVLNVLNDRASPAEWCEKIEKVRNYRHAHRTPRDRRRVNAIRRVEEAKSNLIGQRQKMLTPEEGQLGLDKHVAERIAIEHGGAITAKGAVGHLQDVKRAEDLSNELPSHRIQQLLGEPKPTTFSEKAYRAAYAKEWNEMHKNDVPKPPFPEQDLNTNIKRLQQEANKKLASWEARAADVARDIEANKPQDAAASRIVKILWADLRDGTHAHNWPENVFHSTLDPKAVLKREHTVVRQEAMIDEEGHDISEQRQSLLVQAATSPHIFGRDTQEQWYKSPLQQQENLDTQSAPKKNRWNEIRRQEAVKRLMSLRDAVANDTARLAPLEEQGDEDNKDLEQLEAQLQAMQIRYPTYDEELERIDYYLGLIAQQQNAEKESQELDMTDPDRLTLSEQDSELRQAIRDSPYEYPHLRELELEKFYLLGLIERQSGGNQSRVFLSDLLPPGMKISFQEMSEADPAARVAALEQEIQLAKVDVVLSKHQEVLRELDDENAENATISPRSAETLPTQSSSFNKIQKELEQMGVATDLKDPSKKGLWSRVKGVFGR